MIENYPFQIGYHFDTSFNAYTLNEGVQKTLRLLLKSVLLYRLFSTTDRYCYEKI